MTTKQELKIAKLEKRLSRLEGRVLTSVPSGAVFTDTIATGGGSGSAIEVQDEGASLATNVNRFNFVGDGVVATEPASNEIQITIGNFNTSSSELCPGYAFNFIDTDTFSIVGFDVTNIFSVGRRLKFVDGANTYFGVIASRDFGVTTAGDTTANMTMEGVDVLTATITEVCLVTGTAGWSPIVSDPFNGRPITDLTAGFIGATKYWVIVGTLGDLAYSTDAALNWTVVTLTTTENINSIDYNETDQTFMAGGQAGLIIRSENGTTWIEDTTSVQALDTQTAPITGHVQSIVWDNSFGQWCIFYNRNGGSTSYNSASSIDSPVNWINAAINVSVDSSSAQASMEETVAGGSDTRIVYTRTTELYALDDPEDTIGGLLISNIGQAAVSAILKMGHNLVNYAFIGHSDGVISRASVRSDSVTFGSSQINRLEWFAVHERLVAVANDGKIGYIDTAIGLSSVDSWVLVSNGFNPLTSIQCLHWDSGDGIGIAGANNGQICRSTNGII